VTALDDLLDDIFDGRRPPLYHDFAAWARGSRRFSAFAATYRAKIRAKLRNARDDGGLLGLRAELATAALLLCEERFSVEYERYTALKQRGPDFTVTFKTHTPFNVEVRRMRGAELDGGDSDAQRAKLMAVLIDKVGQMPPSIINLLWLSDDGALAEADIAHAATTLRQLAERKSDDLFARSDFDSAADFLRRYQRLSGVVLRQADACLLWLNPIARHPAPPELITTIRRLEMREER